jgi:hypothetical protein
MKIIKNNANIVYISKEDYDYVLMTIHLSNIMKDYIVNNLKNGIVNVININDNTSGYIYKTNDGSFYLFNKNKSIRISR